MIQLSLWEFIFIVERLSIYLTVYLYFFFRFELHLSLNKWLNWVWKNANCWSSNSRSLSQQNYLNFRELPYQGPWRNLRSTENSTASNRIIPAELPNIQRDRRAPKRIVEKKYRTTAANVTAELNQHLNSPVSTKTVRR